MHRCGTSYMASSLGKMGLNLPNSMGPPSKDNLMGHFEPLDIVEINDEILEMKVQIGSTLSS